MPISQAKVKSALSGDTLVLVSVNNPTQERQLSLAYVSAPRLRKDGEEVGSFVAMAFHCVLPALGCRNGVYIPSLTRVFISVQPFAFESRDFIRRLVVGKVVQFQVLYQVPGPTSKREYGTVSLPNGQTLPEAAVVEGWLKVRDDAGRKDDAEEATAQIEKLKLSEASARSNSKGLWAPSGGVIDVNNELPDPKAFAEQYKGQSIDAIVERVLSGDRLAVRLQLSPKQHQQTIILVAGIRAPATRRTNPSDGIEVSAEPHGDEAKDFVETRLLQRSVKIEIVGVSQQNQLVSIVKHPNGSIAEFILKAGLARCADFHSTMLGPSMATLRQAEKEAKENNLGLFKGHVAKGGSGAAKNAEAIVSRVQNADTIYLRTKAGVEKRVSLSSIRQPKSTDPKQSPFSAEAKEFLRKKLIGKHVKVTIDGKRPAQENFEEREMATVVFNDKNVALLLVENGYASVIRHRRDDEDRSPIYDELLAAEEVAQKEQKGMYAKKPPASKQFVDASESVQKAKIQFSVLQRQKKVPAIVDFVKSGSRFTILVPRENAKLTFVLSGIRAPRSARNPNEKGEPFGQEAHDFAVRRCMQRDVEIDVESLDSKGGFIGTLYVNRESFAKLLVEEGLASVHAYSAEQSGNSAEFFAAEKKAKETRKGMWHDWDPSKENDNDNNNDGGEQQLSGAAGEKNNDDAASAPRKKDYRDVVVTNVGENAKLKLQQIGTGTAALTEMMSAFKTFHLNKANSTPLSGPPKAGEVVAARFSEDGEWYRAKVFRVDREAKQAEVNYIDYGNSEKLPWSRLRPLNQPQFVTSKLRPQAVDAVLSFLQFPTQAEYLNDAINFIGQTTNDKQLVANVDSVGPDGTLYITLFDPKVSGSLLESYNADIVAEGLAMVPKKLKAWERTATDVLPGLRAKEEEAKKARRGMWEYGDLTED
ncbi:hypothetical protein GP486_006627 [Trichoglossum hirsutum]|uniref:Probable endonuclease LCL3 n=1 Tax=Trichoglossum hirsutum TaxID=265104 RepID=A0A9P8ID78_9PEZI|nr:hypothetical protein GP486_006627 [Trichoglossum hirsutum]